MPRSGRGARRARPTSRRRRRGTAVVPGGAEAEAVGALGDAGRVAELAGDASKVADVGKAVDATASTGTAAADAGKAAEGAGDVSQTAEVPRGARGPSSGRTFDPDKAGGPIVPRSLDDVKITHESVDRVQTHLSRFEQQFGPDPFNDAMMARQHAIADGKLEPTIYDKAFHSHELDEYQRYQNMGFKEGVPEDPDEAAELWNNTHTAALEDYGLPDYSKDPITGQRHSNLYHPSCDPNMLPENWKLPPGYPFNN